MLPAGMMLWSIHYMQNSGDWLSGVWYTVLLNMKHLFVYCGPLYAAHIFSHWCQPAGPVKGTVRLAVMGFTVLGITAISFGPFYLNGTLPKVRGQRGTGVRGWLGSAETSNRGLVTRPSAACSDKQRPKQQLSS